MDCTVFPVMETIIKEKHKMRKYNSRLCLSIHGYLKSLIILAKSEAGHLTFPLFSLLSSHKKLWEMPISSSCY